MGWPDLERSPTTHRQSGFRVLEPDPAISSQLAIDSVEIDPARQTPSIRLLAMFDAAKAAKTSASTTRSSGANTESKTHFAASARP
jgi:hypothetical protein